MRDAKIFVLGAAWALALMTLVHGALADNPVRGPNGGWIMQPTQTPSYSTGSGFDCERARYSVRLSLEAMRRAHCPGAERACIAIDGQAQ